MADKPTIELHEAFFWICEACGRDNFIRAVSHIGFPPDMSAKEKKATAKLLGEDKTFGWTEVPKEVTCESCKETFPAESI